MLRPLKVLISAYACAPGRGSEPGVGWNLARTMAKHHRVWVLTDAGNRIEIEEELARRPLPGLRFEYLTLPGWMRVEDSGYGFRFVVHARYYFWQLIGIRHARRLHREIGFDVLHHATFCKYWTPSMLAFVSAPFVWGPVGGGDSVPRPFSRYLDSRIALFERVRTAARWFAERDPLVRLTARRSTLALAATMKTKRRLEALGARRVIVHSGIGLSKSEIGLLTSPSTRDVERGPVIFMSLANLIPEKGLHLGIEAFSRVADDQSEYWIVGDGPYESALRSQSEKLGVSQRVRFLGRLPRDEVLTLLAEGDVFVHMALRETGGYAVLEAMGAGLPVICFDEGGPATSVTEATGIKIAVGGREEIVRSLAGAMSSLASTPDLRRRMGAAARERIRATYEWGKKSELMNVLYDSILNDGAAVSRTS